MNHHAPRRRSAGPLSACLALALSAVTSGCHSLAPSPDWLGVNTHWLAHTNSPAAGRTIDLGDDLALLETLHIRHVRAPLMNWEAVESTPGARPDFAAPDRVIRQAQGAGINLVAVCATFPAWARTNEGLPDVDRIERFAEFVSRFVARYDGNGWRDMTGLRRPILHYELAFDLLRLEPEAYAVWAEAFAAAVKKSAPQAKVILGGLVNPGLDPCEPGGRSGPDDFARLADTIVAAHGPDVPFDAVSFSCFPLQCLPIPDPFNTATGFLRKVMADRGFDRPLWLSGYGQNVNQTAPEQQATNLVKWTLVARTMQVERMYIHALAEVEPPGRPRGAYGLTYRVMDDHAPIKRKAFETVAVLAEQLSRQQIVTYHRPGVYMLTGRQEPTYVVWEPDVYTPPRLDLSGWWEVRRLDGRSAVLPGREIQAGPKPIYLQTAASPFRR